MKKVLFLMMLSFVCQMVTPQKMELTSNGFIDVEDPDKNYVVIEIPETTKEILFKNVKRYLNTIYNNPKFVTSEIENEQIVVDAIDSKDIKVIFRLSGSNIWNFSYKYEFQFKDNKLKFTPFFKSLINTEDGEEIKLIGASLLGNATGVFNNKGKVLKKGAKERIDEIINEDIAALKNNLLSEQSEKNDDW